MRDSFKVEFNTDQISTLLYFSREEAKSEISRIVFLIHGFDRKAGGMIRRAMSLDVDENIIFVAPRFSKEAVRHKAALSIGNMKTAPRLKKPINSEEYWTFDIVPRTFDILKRKYNVRDKYSLFGHSAGAQFVHRFVMFSGCSRLHKAVAANAGWYTFLSQSDTFPYGLGGVEDRFSIDSLSQELTVLLGKEDTEWDGNFRKTERAFRQGSSRLERGDNFIKSAKAYASKQGKTLNWKSVHVEGVGHDSRSMLKAAIRYLL